MTRIPTVCAAVLAGSLLTLAGIYVFLQFGVTVDAAGDPLVPASPVWTAILWKVAIALAVVSGFGLAVSSVAGTFAGRRARPQDDDD